LKLPEDPFVRELLPEFIDTWINDINLQLEMLVSYRNEEDLYRFGHTLKGSCLQFGLDDIAALGIELMGYAKEQEWEKAILLKPLFIDAFKKVKAMITPEPN
jgi:hypothetical protein